MSPRRPLPVAVISAAVALAVLTMGCGFSERVIPTPAPTPDSSPAVGWAWHDAPGETYRGQNGRTLDYVCPPDGGLGDLWGTDIYTDDSSVCTAGVHAGYLSREEGGRVRIEIMPGRASYASSIRNGVASTAYGPWDGSFVIVAACRGDGCAPTS